MLSTYQLFKGRDPVRRRKIQTPQTSDGFSPKQELSAQDKVYHAHLREFLLPDFDNVKKLEKVIAMFNRYLTGYPEESELERLAGYIASATRDCCSYSDEAALEAGQLIADFIESNNLEKLKECAWAQDLQVANDFSVRYLGIAFEVTIEEIWQVYLNTVSSGKFEMAVAIAQNIIVATLFYINVNIKIAEAYIDLFSESSRIDLSLGMEKKAAKSLSIVEENVEAFFERMSGREILEGVLVYAFDKYLFDSYMLRAKLAIRRSNVKELNTYIEKVAEIKKRGKCKQMHRGYCELKNAEAQIKQRIRNEDRAPRSKPSVHPIISEQSSEHTSYLLNDIKNDPQTFDDHSPLKMVSTSIKPKCYQDGTPLGQQIDNLGELMESAGIYGYINGSSTYKSDPGDIDLVFVNMSQADNIEKFKIFFASMADQGALIPRNYSESLGHIKGDLHIIAVPWLHSNYKKVDTVLWERSLYEHAMEVDKTLGALYYCPRRKVTFRAEGLTSIADLQRHKINFHGDAVAKLLHDPDIIFMNFKLHFEEGFNFSANSWDAIAMFAKQADSQIFNRIYEARLFARLKVLLGGAYQLAFMDCLVRLDLFAKLYEYLAEKDSRDGVYYFNVLHNYYFHSQQMLTMQYVTNTYAATSVAYTQGYSCNFYAKSTLESDRLNSESSQLRPPF